MRLPIRKAPTRPATAGVDVHHGAAREVERAPLPDQAGLGVHGVDHVLAGIGVRAHPEPDHVRDRRIAEGEPQRHEEQHGRELDALGEGAHDQAAGDAGEGGLEGGEQQLGDVDALAEGRARREGAGGGVEDALHEEAIEAADEGVALGEGQAVAVDQPQHHDHREGDHDLHQHRQHVLAAHQAAVEEGQAGDGHHDDQQRRQQHPGGVALVERGRRRRGRCASAAAAAAAAGAAAAGAAGAAAAGAAAAGASARRRRRLGKAGGAGGEHAQAQGERDKQFFHWICSFVPRSQRASRPVSPVRMRTTCSRS